MACSPVAVSVAPDAPPLRSASMPRSTASTSTAIWRGVHRAVDVTFALGGRDGLRQFGLVSIDEAFDAAGDRLIGGRQFGGALSRQAAVPLGICGVGSRRAADVANQPIVGRLGRVPELGTYCGHRHVGVFVKCPQENGVLVTEGAVETAAPQTGHCDQVIERCAGHPVGLRARPAHRRHRGGRRLCRSQPGRQVAR